MKKILILVLSMAALAFCLAGCSSGTGTEANTQTGAANDLSNTTVIGKVTAIDGNSITLQLGELTQSDRNKDNTVTSDQSTSNSSDSSSDQSTSGEAPTDNSSGNSSSGNPPSDQAPPDNSSEMAPSGNPPSGGPMTFTAGDNSVTFTVDDDFAIILDKQTTAGTIDDIAIDDILEVTFGDNNTVTAITVKNLNGGPGGSGGPGQAGGPNGSGQVPDGDSGNMTNQSSSNTNKS